MELVRRIRWSNVARAAAVAAAVGLLLAWPQLRPRAPSLPADPVLVDTPPPVVREEPEVAEPRAEPRTEARRGALRERKERRRGEPRRRAADGAAEREEGSGTPAAAPVAPAPPAPVAPGSPAPSPAQDEFGFE